MPCKGVRDAKSDSKGCLLYPYNRHPLLRNKASLTVVQGIRTSVSRHRYKQSPSFAKSGWQNDGSHSENGHGHSCDHVTARVKPQMFCKLSGRWHVSSGKLQCPIGCKHISFRDKSLRSHGHSCDRDRFGVPRLFLCHNGNLWVDGRNACKNTNKRAKYKIETHLFFFI